VKENLGLKPVSVPAEAIMPSAWRGGMQIFFKAPSGVEADLSQVIGVGFDDFKVKYILSGYSLLTFICTAG